MKNTREKILMMLSIHFWNIRTTYCKRDVFKNVPNLQGYVSYPAAIRMVCITINVPLFKKMRDIIFFLRDNNFLSRFEGNFEGAKTFLTPYIVPRCARDNLGVKKVEAPSKCPEKDSKSYCSKKKKNYVPNFLKQRDIGNFMSFCNHWPSIL